MTIQSDPVPSDRCEKCGRYEKASIEQCFIGDRDCPRVRTLAPTRETAPALSEPDAYRWRFHEGKDRTWRHQAMKPGFDPTVVECEPLAVIKADREQRPAELSEVSDADILHFQRSNGWGGMTTEQAAIALARWVEKRVRAACEGAGSIPSAEEREVAAEDIDAMQSRVRSVVMDAIDLANRVSRRKNFGATEKEKVRAICKAVVANKNLRAALAVPSEGAEFEPGTCARCGKDYSMPDPQMEPTKYCNDCAHVIAESVPVGPSEGIASVAASDAPSEREHELCAAIESAMEFIEHFVDVIDGPDGEPQANSAMELMESLRAALAAPDESLSRQSSEAAESHRSTRKTQAGGS